VSEPRHLDTFDATQQPGHGLLRDLVHATYWLDDGLQTYMREHAGLSLPRAQSMMMVYIAEGVDRPADLAVRLRVSKQAVQQGLKELIAKDMVTTEADPENGRQKIVRFTEHGRELRDIARKGLESLEAQLIRRIGADRLHALRDGLIADWGKPPGDHA
jgi:DNA-binding MarR family transcriptional regulator